MSKNSGIDFAVGGQAVIEGVMIRSPNFVTVAIRKKDGSIKIKEDPFRSLTKKFRLLALPIIRGMVNLIEMMVFGMKALNFSAEEFAEDEEDTSQNAEAKSASQSQNAGMQPSDHHDKQAKPRWFTVATFTFSLIVSFALAIFLFKFIPLALTTFLQKIFPAIAKYTILFNIIDGLIRIAIFLIYIFVLSLFKTFQRIFEYHGAEHKSIFAYEKGHALTMEHIRPESPRHPRCGTSFIVIVLVISIILLSLVPKHPVFYIHFLRRLAIIPLIAGAAYEVLKWTAKHRHHWIVGLLTYPGILTQYITTREPDEKQIEVAVAALKKALELEKNADSIKEIP